MPVVMSSLGISLLVENGVQIAASPDTQILIYDYLTRTVAVGSLQLRILEVWLVVIFVLLTAGLYLFMHRTRVGEGFAAMIEDPKMAELVGIPIARMRIGAYCAGAVLGAFSGMAMLVDTGLRPAQGFVLLLYALIITIMGRRNLQAVALWAVLFGVLRALWSWQLPTEFQELAMFALMISYLVGRDAWDRYQRNRLVPLSPRTLPSGSAMQDA